MGSTKRLIATVIVVLMALSATLATPATAQDRPEAVRLNDYIQIKSKRTAAVIVGDTAWITVSIRGKRDVEDVRFTAALKEDGSVAYPANTVDHSGPYNDYELDRKETDYVAFQITIPAGFDKRKASLELEATFTHNGDQLIGSGQVKVPVVEFYGSPYTLISDEVTLSESANGWVEVGFAGLAPRLEGFEVKVVDPTGLEIYYPLETFTSLAGDNLLEDGESDVVRFRLGESLWGSPLTVELEVKYVFEGNTEAAAHTLAIIPA